ncbi:hypothetical protein J1605_016812 [Eschrichtius robustus]|uniref:Uncharacterized protein n=1 Tax=Eschrichtius robustus TaxID=9764 RepID=A0AB34I3N1_ESCRO|nr:hypothetical protein J1605_016812 [Eschrichtius robustus]
MWARTEPLGSLEKRASQVCKALLGSLDQGVPLAPKGKTGNLGTLDIEENWASKVRQAHLDQLVSWVLRERQEKQGLWVRGDPQAPLDLLVNKVFQAWKAERGPRGTWDHWDPLGRKGHLDAGASLVPKEPPGTQ